MTKTRDRWIFTTPDGGTLEVEWFSDGLGWTGRLADGRYDGEGFRNVQVECHPFAVRRYFAQDRIGWLAADAPFKAAD